MALGAQDCWLASTSPNPNQQLLSHYRTGARHQERRPGVMLLFKAH